MENGYSYTRADRVGDLIKAEIAEIISRKIKDPRIGLITVTAVKVTNDLRNARVYISPPIQGESGETSIKTLDHASGFIRKELGRRLQLRHVPELFFELESDSSSHVLELLDQLNKKNGEGNRTEKNGKCD